MPLTNTQKILAWGSAGLIATASALGVMFYSPTVLGQTHLATLSHLAVNAKSVSYNDPDFKNKNSIYYHATSGQDVYKNALRISGLASDNDNTSEANVMRDAHIFASLIGGDYKPTVLSSDYDHYGIDYETYYRRLHTHHSYYFCVMQSLKAGINSHHVCDKRYKFHRINVIDENSASIETDSDTNADTGSSLSSLPSTQENDLGIGKHRGKKSSQYTTVIHGIGNVSDDRFIHARFWYGDRADTITQGSGNLWSGAPYHPWIYHGYGYYGWSHEDPMLKHDFNLVAHRGPAYDNYIGWYHTQLAESQLETRDPSYGYHHLIVDQLPLSQPDSDENIKIRYPESARYQYKDKSGYHTQIADVYLTVSHIKYSKPWRKHSDKSSARYIEFSKDLHQGFRYNGIVSAHIRYDFYDHTSHKPLKLNNSYIRIGHLDGLSKYAYKDPKETSGTDYLDDASYNDEYMLYQLINNHQLDKRDITGQFVTSNNMQPYYYGDSSQIRRYYSKLLKEYVIGGKYNSFYYFKNPYDHSVAFEFPPNASEASFTAGSGVGYGLFKPSTSIVRHHCPHSNHRGGDTPVPQNPNTAIKKYILPSYEGNKIHVQKEPNNNDDVGGVLRHPKQEYWYKIVGTTPTYQSGSDMTEHSVNEGTSKNPDYKEEPYNTSDYFEFHDHLPKDVSIKKIETYGLSDKINATADGDNDISFTLDRNGMGGSILDNSGHTYTIYVKVEANHLPPIHHAGWHTYWNGGQYNSSDQLGTYDQYKTYNSNGTKTDVSNTIPVEIKKLKADVWHYDYNHDHNVGSDAFVPDKFQPAGITNHFKNPSYRYFKNYRFHRYFNTNDQAGLLDHSTHYWYEGTYHNINTINKSRIENIDGQNQTQRYRFVYPSFPGYADSSSDNNEVDLFHILEELLGEDSDSYTDYTKSDFVNYEKELWHPKANGLSPADSLDNGNQHHIIINANPDKGTYYTDNQFTQNNYLPYIIPHISIGTGTSSSDGTVEHDTGDSRMVIDTDKAKHGLPFRLDLRNENLLYGQHYLNDFAGDKINMTITSGTHTLYSDTRPLVGPAGDHDALIHEGDYHYPHVEYSESPKGDTEYKGYIESDALQHVAETDHDDYNLFTSSDRNGDGFTPGEKIPIHVHFSLEDPDSSQDEVNLTDINSHAYISSKPTINHNSFGLEKIEGDGSNGNGAKINSNRATVISPERTIEYGSDPATSSNKYGTNVRELKEQLSVTQPQNAVGKTGYGISANDFGLDYRGHLEAPHYAKRGTNMQFAFPRVFNSKDSNMDYSHDNDSYNPTKSSDEQSINNPYTKNSDNTLLADNLLHVDPNINSDTYNSLNNYGESDKDLDTHHGNHDEDDVDSEFRGEFPEGLHPGDFSTTYGFYPRTTVNNIGDNNDNGNISLANKDDGGIFNSQQSDFDDPSITPGTNNSPTKINGHGLTTNGYPSTNSSNTHSIATDGQNERMFTPLFLKSGKYHNVFHTAYGSNYGGASSDEWSHRLGGNFFNIDEDRPINMIGHQYIAKDSNTKDKDELSLQPILTNPQNGLMQTPLSNPAFPITHSNDHGWLNNDLWTTTGPF